MVRASGFFELEIVELQNPSGRLASGGCCSGAQDSAAAAAAPATAASAAGAASPGAASPGAASPGAASPGVDWARSSGDICGRECSTFFRLCLKEYQSNVTVSSPCTYGNDSSPVLGGNSFTFLEPDRSHARLVLPFSFRWTVSLAFISNYSGWWWWWWWFEVFFFLLSKF